MKNKLYEVLEKLFEYDFSDIHIKENEPIYVRNHIKDIQVIEHIVIWKDDIRWLLQTNLTPNKLEDIINNKEVDFSFSYQWKRYRVNAYIAMNWINLALRKIPENPPTFEQIELPEHIKKSLLKDKWLILVTWPTWSWKSTTLAAMIEYINENKKVHILTLEDPIEFIYKNKKALITQREVTKHSKSWADAIKYALRQDPDVIMVWEMRDLESISAVLTLVETWHLVLSTLHTIDAAQTINRIIDVFPPHQQDQIAIQLSLSLELIISQKLLPRVDWKGKIAAREILYNTDAVANNIRQRKIPQIVAIMETWFRLWMKTMDRSLAELVAKWLITEEEALTKISNHENFFNMVKALRNEKTIFKPID